MTTPNSHLVEPESESASLPNHTAPASAINPLAIFLRRWPFLALGLVVGLVIGVLLHLTTSPQYESSAQVLVVKKRAELVKEGDVRVGAVEDYVATQLSLIKSEKIGLAAARVARQMGIPNLPANDVALSGLIRGGLTVSRDKESAAPGRGGNGVLVLGFRGGDPEDCRRLLDAVIKAHQEELYAIYDQASQEKVKALDKMASALRNQRKEAAEERISLLVELRKITTEEVASIRSRVSAIREQERAMRAELENLTDQFDTINAVGANPRDRALTLAQFTAQAHAQGSGPVTPESTAPDSLIRSLEAQRRELVQAHGLGKDHPRILALTRQIDFMKEELDRKGPNGGPGLDDLGAYGKWVEQKKRTAERTLKQFRDQLKQDEETLKAAGGLQDRAESLAGQVLLSDTEIKRVEAEKLATQATEGAGGYITEPITPPANGRKVAPVLARSLMSGLAIGLLLGVAAGGLAEWADKSFRTAAEIRQRLGLSVIGHIPPILPDSPEGDGPPGLSPILVSAHKSSSAGAEACRGLRTQLFFCTQGRGQQVIQVTSPVPGDGKSTVAANLAISVAQSGKRTVLVDCDFRKPMVHKLFGVKPSEIGMAGVVSGLGPLTPELIASGVENLDLLPCGPRPANPADLLTSTQFQKVLADLREEYDFVIVDTPPLLAVTDPTIIAPRVDGVVLVFRMGPKCRPNAERGREQLVGVGAKILGVVVNASEKAWGGHGYGYDYSNTYKYDYYQYGSNRGDNGEEPRASVRRKNGTVLPSANGHTVTPLT